VPRSCDRGTVAAIPLGRASLPGSVLPTRRLVRSHTSRQAPKRPPTPAYLVLLRVEIARFTRCRVFRFGTDSSLLL